MQTVLDRELKKPQAMPAASGAGDGARTRMPAARDFKSLVSASSTTPAWDYVITCAAGVSITAKFLLTFLRAGAIIVEHSKCASGGTGRHLGLKIPCDLQSPTAGFA